MSIIDDLSKPLSIDDIEFRIGSVAKAKQGEQPKGFSMVAYKTARTDVKRLNDCVGLNWKNKYFYDTTGILCCEISIYNNEIKEWISRVDVGTESMTEKEKGTYSDAFKRAGFKWGIGAELYNFPFIWINWNDYSEYNNKFTPKNFDNKSIKIDEYVVENAEVKKLKLTHKGTVIFEFGKNVKVPEKQIEKEKQEEQKPIPKVTKKIDESQAIELNSLFTSDEHKNDFLATCKISKIEDLPLSWYDKAVEKLSK